MPDRLDHLLDATRKDLLQQIKGPDLVRVNARARTLRRRRRSTVTTAALGVLVLLVGAGALLAQQSRRQHPEPANPATATPYRSVWSGADLTVLGLDVSAVTDLPGDLSDVEFVDASQGYALAVDCGRGAPCPIALASTKDSGNTWRVLSTPPMTVGKGDGEPGIVPLGPTGLVVTGPVPYFSADGGQTWVARPAPATLPQATAVPAGGKLYLASPTATGGPDCQATAVQVWQLDGSRALLARQPQLGVCWVAAAPTSDGVWWVGGQDAQGRPAVAASRDAGVTWTTVPLPATSVPSWARITVVGTDVYAAATTGRATPDAPAQPVRLVAIHRSTDGGRTFAPVGDGRNLPTMVGDLVPLLDGRLLVAAPGLTVSGANGSGFRAAPDTTNGGLPFVGLIRRTGVGWVAYDLFSTGWAAYTTDGKTWHKITVK